MSNSVLPTTTRRSLRYDFTALEIQEFGFLLGHKTQEKESKIEEKKSVVSQWKATIDSIQSEINKLSRYVTDKFEYRETECSIEYNKPESGKKTLTRVDNKEKIIEKMEDWEWNLFTDVGKDDLLSSDDLGKENPAGKDEKPKRKGKTKTEKLFNGDGDDAEDVLL